MHIILALLSAIAGLIWALTALQRTGFRLDSLNPFAWYRRSQWLKVYREKPIYNLGEPIDAAALLLLGVVKCEGEISAEQKRTLIGIFENDFHLSNAEACDLLLASSHLIRNEIYISDQLAKILEKSANRITEAQIQSILTLMNRMGTVESSLNDEQKKLISGVETFYLKRKKIASSDKW
jgi:uncharacterized tellurite resistance protein B-like protein